MLNGIINVYKEPGYTSADVVAKLRGITHQKKIGHTGTLDPAAEGVLPVCLGKATKLCGLLTDEKKTYEAVLLLGRDTDTQDTTGKTIAEREVTCTREEIQEVLESFVGDQMQIPPMYSALKHNGKRLYELARNGQTVERQPRPVHFYEIRMLSADLPHVTIRVTCSRGTYIRTLCHDIGEKLGCGGCMEHLVRTRVGEYTESGAFTLARISEKAEAGNLKEIIKPTDSFFQMLPPVSTRNSGDSLAHNGNQIPLDQISNALADSLWGNETAAAPGPVPDSPFSGTLRVYDSVGVFIGIYRVDLKKDVLVPLQMFYDPEESVEIPGPYEKYIKDR